MDYGLVKTVHVGAVATSLALFLLRGVWMLRADPRLQKGWSRVVPHVVDTVLLVSAVWLALRIGQAPLRDDWLTAKVGGLLAYIVLGSVALKRGRSARVRRIALLGALAVFAYIVAVALTKCPLPWS